MSKKQRPPDRLLDWVVRLDGEDYAAGTFETLSDWFRRGKVGRTSKVWNPDSRAWVEPDSLLPRLVEGLFVTTTNSIEGYRISKYIDIASVEVVLGTGVISEISSGVSDLFGARSTDFEVKLQRAKILALQRLKYSAVRRGGDALVGVDLDYTEFSGNRVGVIANGTIVKLEAVAD